MLIILSILYFIIEVLDDCLVSHVSRMIGHRACIMGIWHDIGLVFYSKIGVDIGRPILIVCRVGIFIGI